MTQATVAGDRATRQAPAWSSDRTDKLHIAGMATFVAALTAAGWIVLSVVVAPARFALGSGATFGIGLGVTAYLLGVRHAFDADHIAAIDNTTRKLVGEGRRARGVGFWFSLGHSSVVFLLALLLALGVRTLVGRVGDDSSSIRAVLGVVGTLAGGGFLLLIGLLNLQALLGIGKVFARMRREPLDDQTLERHLASRGLMARLLGRVMRAVSKPWHMYAVGLLFGIGFDTATEVALLVLSGGAAALSVLVALMVGLAELLQLLSTKLHISTGPLAAFGGLDLETMGYVIVGLFIGTWLVALAVWRFGKIEQRWNLAELPSSDGLHSHDSSQNRSAVAGSQVA